MSPEQALSNTALPDVRSDVYSLGATLYYGLTGRPPFSGQSMDDLIGRVLHQPPTPPSVLGVKISRDLEAICLKALQKNPADRYATAAALADDLRRSLVGLPVTARRYPLVEMIGRALRARKEMLASGVALVILMVAALYAAVSMLTTTAETALMDDIRNNVIDTAELAAMMIDPELVKTVSAQEFGDHAAAKQLAEQLDTIRRISTGVRFIYILRQQQRHNPVLEFVVSSASFLSATELDVNHNGSVDEDEKAAQPGELFDATPYPALLVGLREPGADEQPHQPDQWQIAFSGYAPIIDAQNQAIAVLAVDISSQQLYRYFASLRQSHYHTLLVSLALALLALVLLVSTLVGLWKRDQFPAFTQ
ncbi:hypothetical protein CKO12_12140 [Chromatium okenii]|nr:hypothetical protein [Chromatium okenii]